MVAYGVRRLDGGAIGDGVGKRHTKLDDLGATLLHGKEDIGCGIGSGEAGGDIGNEGSL